MNNVTKKWLLMRVSSVVLIPLMTWFILNLVSVFNKDYVDIVNFFSNQPSKILVSLLLVFAYFFSALSISEVFEDYIQDEKIKNVANKTLNIFAIIVPTITIIIIFKLNITIIVINGTSIAKILSALFATFLIFSSCI